MRWAAMLVVLGMAACVATGETTPTAPSVVDDWQTPTGKPPTKAEFIALVAACQDKVKTTAESAPMSGCLADLGLRRVQ